MDAPLCRCARATAIVHTLVTMKEIFDMFVSLARIRRSIGCVAFLVAALLVAPVAHDLHDASDEECTLCQLRQNDSAVLADALAFAEDLEPTVRRDSTVIDWVESVPLSTAPARAPPA